MSLTVQENASETAAPIVAPACDTCGTVAAPDGACLEIGACSRADALATRGASGATAKFAVPAAWNALGRVD